MPSSDDCISADNVVKKLAIKQLCKEGHAVYSAIEIVERMDRDERIQKAEQYTGNPFYRGPYSPYGS